MDVKLFCMVTIDADALNGVRAEVPQEGHPLCESVLDAAARGADSILLFDAAPERMHEEAIHLLRAICRTSVLPVYVAGQGKRLEDVKKYLYAGSEKVVLSLTEPSQRRLLTEAAARFGKEKIAIAVDSEEVLTSISAEERAAGSEMITTVSPKVCNLTAYPLPVTVFDLAGDPLEAWPALTAGNACGYCSPLFTTIAYPLEEYKKAAMEAGCAMHVLTAPLSFRDLKKDENGLVPVVVVEESTKEILMLAYMDEEAYDHTLFSGKMTYFSRSRREQWVKGVTSGHYQYVRSLRVDCDRDTLLAEVVQIGAACHTGNHSCFYTSLVSGEGKKDEASLAILQKVYDTVTDRKANPREGSYTNYLFDQGIDKILKKIGEEAAETIIAAKNEGSEELVYEICDYLYHLNVLMAEKQVTWQDITEELARRHN